jgi:large-conductance mechanosensitive channel
MGHALCELHPATQTIDPELFTGAAMHIWAEFKNTILPWLIAAAVIALLMVEHRRTTAALLAANGRLADAVEVQGRALEGVRDLLAKQGYTLPPLDGSQ